MSDPIRSISQNNFILADQKEVSHDNTLSGNGTEASPLGVDDEYIKLLEVTQPMNTAVASYQATATVPDGYKFLCWVNTCTNGFSRIFYPLSPTNTTTTWWIGGEISAPSSGNTVTSRYLVIKDN